MENNTVEEITQIAKVLLRKPCGKMERECNGLMNDDQ